MAKQATLLAAILSIVMCAGETGKCAADSDNAGTCSPTATVPTTLATNLARAQSLGEMLSAVEGAQSRAEQDASKLRAVLETMASMKQQLDGANEMEQKRVERERQEQYKPPSEPLLLSKDPLIWQIDNFLSGKECDHLLSLPTDKWEEAKVSEPVTAPEAEFGVVMAEQRSYQTFPVPGTKDDAAESTDGKVTDMLERMHNAANLPLHYGLGETLQVIN